MADLISEIVGQEAYQQVEKLVDLLEKAETTMRQVANTTISIDLKTGGGAGALVTQINETVAAGTKAGKTIDELTLAVDAYKKILDATARTQAQMNASTSEEAKTLAEAKVQMAELNRILKEQAQAENALFQERKKQAQAQKEAIENDKREIAEAKQMLQLQRDLEKRLKDREAATQRDMAEQAKAEKALADLNNGYKQMSAELARVTAEGKKAGIELGRSAPEYQKLKDRAKELREQLYAIDSDFGDHRRNIGNYRSAFNGLAASFNQLTRELPALAINANTFFLAISNNIPIFVDEIKRATSANKEAKEESRLAAAAAGEQAKQQALNNGKTEEAATAIGEMAAEQALANSEGKKGTSILKQLGAAIFSWQTLLSIGVALLTVYGGKILEVFTGGKTAADRYNEALEKVAETTATDIAELTLLQTALTSSTKTRLDLQKAMDDARSKYPEYLNFLGEENISTEQLNVAIEKQIELIETRAKQKAADEAFAETVKERTEAEDKLREVMTGNINLWDRAKAVVTRYQLGLKDQTDTELAMLDAQNKVAQAQKQVNDAKEFAINPIKALVSEQIIYQQKLKDEIAETQKQIDIGQDLFGTMQGAVNSKRNLIKVSEEYVIQMQNEYAQTMLLTKSTLTMSELAAMNAQTRALQAKKGTAEETRLQREARYAQLRVEEEALKKQNYAQTEYEVRLANLRAKADNDLENLEKKKATRARKFDGTRSEIKANEDLNRALADFYKQRLQADQAFQQTIFENETNTLEQRLEAHQQFIQDEKDLYNIETGLELTNLYARLEKIAEIRKTAEGKRTNAQKALLNDEEAINTQIETIILARQFNISRIEDEGAKKQRDIIKSSTTQALKMLDEQLQEQENLVEEKRREATTALNQEYEQGLINYRTYNMRYKALQVDANKELHDTQVEFLRNQISNAENTLFASLGLSEEEREAVGNYLKGLRKELSDLTAPKELENRKPVSLMHLLGFGNDPNATTEQIIAKAKQDLSRLIENLWGTIFDLMDAARDASYQKQYDQLDFEKAQLQERTEAERKAIESEMLAEEEKQRRLSELNGRALAEEKSIDNERKALQREQAQREKDDAIFKIAMNGAIAASQALSTIVSGNPASVAIAIASAAVIAAQTAAAIAIANSRPIPQYFEGAGPGTPNPSHGGGLAIVGEVGSEKVTLPSGKSFMTPDTATLMNLPKGTNVTPADQVMLQPQQKAIALLGASGMPVNEATMTEALASVFKDELSDLKLVIKNKPVIDVSFHNGQMRGVMRRQNGIDSYVGRIKGKA